MDVFKILNPSYYPILERNLKYDTLTFSKKTPQEIVDEIQMLKKIHHNLLEETFLKIHGLNQRDENLNKAENITTEYPSLVKGSLLELTEKERRLTPDLVFKSNDLLVVLDFTISVNPVRASEMKIEKYSYFKKIFKENVEIFGFALGTTVYESRSFLSNFYKSQQTPIGLIGVADFIASERSGLQQLIDSHPKRKDIIDIMLRDETELKIDRQLPKILFKELKELKLSERTFGSDEKMKKSLSYIRDESSYLTESDTNFLKFVANELKEEFLKKEDSLKETNLITQSRVEKAFNNLEIKMGSLLSSNFIPNRSEYYKILPVPFFNITRIFEKRNSYKEFSFNLRRNLISSSTILDFFSIVDLSDLSEKENQLFQNQITLKEKENLQEMRKTIRSEIALSSRKRNWYVSGKRMIRLRTTNETRKLIEGVILKSGVDKLKYFGKDTHKQNRGQKAFTIKSSDSVVHALIKWFTKKFMVCDNCFSDVLTEKDKDFPLSQELKDLFNPLLLKITREISYLGVYKLAQFYEELFFQISLMAEQKSKTRDFLINTLGSNDFILIMQGGAMSSTRGQSRSFWVIKRLSVCDDFPLNACHKYSIVTFKDGSRWYASSAIRLDPIDISHFTQSFKFVRDIITTSMLDTNITTILDLSENDQIHHFFTKTIIWFSNKKQLSTMVQQVRYLVMVLLGIYGDIEDLSEKFIFPLRNILQVYFLKQIIHNAIKFLPKKKISIKKLKFSENMLETGVEDEDIEIETKRILSPGLNTTFIEVVNEFYFANAIEKRFSSKFHQTVQAMEKLMESKIKYEGIYKDSHLREFIYGYSEDSTDEEFAKRLLSSSLDHSVFSRRALIIGSKCIRKSISGKEEAFQRNLHFCKLHQPAIQLATHKSIVKERTENMRVSLEAMKKKKKSLEEFSIENNQFAKFEEKHKSKRKEGKNAAKWRQLHFDFLKEPVTYNEYRSDIRSKALDIFLERFRKEKNEKILTPLMLLKKSLMKKEKFIFELFPKEQIGGAREISIQDFPTRMSTFFVEKISEELCKQIPVEMLTKKDKFVRQSNMIMELKKEHFLNKNKTFFLNEDNTRWGPMMLPHSFMYLFVGIKDLLPENYFDHMSLVFLRMCHKLIEIPKVLYSKWVKEFKPETSNLMYDLIKRFKETGDITFENYNNMGQGILHDTSSVLASARVLFANEIFELIAPGVFKINRQVGSDDKHDAVVINAKTKEEFLHYSLMYNFVDKRIGTLFNIKRSSAKTSFSYFVSEFNSNYNLGGSSTIPRYVRYRALSVVPPALSYESDAKFGLSQIISLAKDGIPLINLYYLQLSYRLFLDKMYRTGKGQKNDPTILFGERSLTPIELGGFPSFCGLEFHSSAISLHLWKILELGNEDQVDIVHYLSSIKAKEDFQLYPQEDKSKDMPGFSLIGINFKVRLTSKVDKLRKEVAESGLNPQFVEKFSREHPIVNFAECYSREAQIMKLGKRLFSNSSLLAFAYDSDVSNYVRMTKLSSSRICSLSNNTSFEKGNLSTGINFKEAMELIHKSFKNSKKEEIYKKSFLSQLLKTEKNSIIDCFSILKDERLITGLEKIPLMIKGSTKARFKSLLSEISKIQTKNEPINVLFFKWYEKDFRELMVKMPYPKSVESDFDILRESVPWLKQTIEATLESMNMIVSEDNKRNLISVVYRVISGRKSNKEFVLTRSVQKFKDKNFFREIVQFQSFQNFKLSFSYTDKTLVVPLKESFLTEKEFDKDITKDICRAFITVCNFCRLIKQEKTDFFEIVDEYFKKCYLSRGIYKNILDFIENCSIDEIVQSVKEPVLLKSVLTGLFGFSGRKQLILKNYFEKVLGAHFVYFKEQSRLKNKGYDLNSDFDFGATYLKSTCRIIKEGSRRELRLDLNSNLHLLPLVKLIVEGLFTEGYSPLPEVICNSPLNQSKFSRVDSQKKFLVKNSSYIVLRSGVLQKLSVGQLRDDDLFLPFPISNLSTGVPQFYNVRSEQYEFSIEKMAIILQLQNEKGYKYQKTLFQISPNIFDYSILYTEKEHLIGNFDFYNHFSLGSSDFNPLKEESLENLIKNSISCSLDMPQIKEYVTTNKEISSLDDFFYLDAITKEEEEESDVEEKVPVDLGLENWEDFEESYESISFDPSELFFSSTGIFDNPVLQGDQEDTRVIKNEFDFISSFEDDMDATKQLFEVMSFSSKVSEKKMTSKSTLIKTRADVHLLQIIGEKAFDLILLNSFKINRKYPIFKDFLNFAFRDFSYVENSIFLKMVGEKLNTAEKLEKQNAVIKLSLFIFCNQELSQEFNKTTKDELNEMFEEWESTPVFKKTDFYKKAKDFKRQKNSFIKFLIDSGKLTLSEQIVEQKKEELFFSF